MKKKKISTPLFFILLTVAGLLLGAAVALAVNAGLLLWEQTSGESSAAGGSKESAYRADGTILYEGVEYTARSKEIAEEYVGELLISLSVESLDSEGQESEGQGAEEQESEEQETEGQGTEGQETEGQETEEQETEEQGTEGQETEGQETEGQGDEEQESEGQKNEGQGTEGQEIEEQETKEQEAENTGIRLYKIENISVICAVAVQQEGSDSWYPAVNTGYCPETLGQFVEDLDLTNTLPIDWFYYHQETDTESWSYIGPADEEEAEKVREVITSRPRAKNEPGLEHEPTTTFVSVSTSLPLLGYENEKVRGYVKIEVYEDGYLMISFEELGEHYFYIGESKAQKFIRYMGQSVEEADNG